MAAGRATGEMCSIWLLQSTAELSVRRLNTSRTANAPLTRSCSQEAAGNGGREIMKGQIRKKIKKKHTHTHKLLACKFCKFGKMFSSVFLSLSGPGSRGVLVLRRPDAANLSEASVVLCGALKVVVHFSRMRLSYSTGVLECLWCTSVHSCIWPTSSCFFLFNSFILLEHTRFSCFRAAS